MHYLLILYVCIWRYFHTLFTLAHFVRLLIQWNRNVFLPLSLNGEYSQIFNRIIGHFPATLFIHNNDGNKRCNTSMSSRSVSDCFYSKTDQEKPGFSCNINLTSSRNWPWSLSICLCTRLRGRIKKIFALRVKSEK